MKKFLSLVFVLLAALALVACSKKEENNNNNNNNNQTTYMTYAEFKAAELKTEVKVDVYVQDTQSWWFDDSANTGKLTVYAADNEGNGYFIYELPVEEADKDKFTKGTEIYVTGTKSEWSGEVEITDATYEFGTKTYTATAKDATSAFADLSAYANQKVQLKNLQVVAMDDAYNAFYYKWNNSGEAGKNHDLYYKVTDGTTTYSFTVESYLMAEGTTCYEAVKALKVGDYVDLEGYVYWYETAQLHTTNVTVKGNAADKSEGVMTYAEFAAAATKTTVTVECYVQAKQSWWFDNDANTGKLTIYATDPVGGYFIYNYECDEETANKLTVGTKIKVVGTKSEWSGEVEITDATITVEDGYYVSVAKDATAALADLSAYANQLVVLKNLKVVAMDDAGTVFYYKYNNSGEAGKNNDLYFKVTDGTTTYTFTVESYLVAEGTACYEAVKTLNVGDTINLTGFAYWYNVCQLHTTNVELVAATAE